MGGGGGGWCTPIIMLNPTVSCQSELELELGFDNKTIGFDTIEINLVLP